MKTNFSTLLFLALVMQLLVFQTAKAQEKLLYTTNFQNWVALNPTTETAVEKTTDFSGESLTFKLFQVFIDPAGSNPSRFNYTLVSDGWAQTQKNAEAYMELSVLKSITKVEFIQGATGSNRGYKVWKKNATDADWVLKYSTPANPAAGQVVTVDINDTDVALKFTSLDNAQNSYMFSLNIWGNYVSSVAQVALTTSVNIEGAGTITRTPNSTMYDQGSVVSLSAAPSFGYKFIKWVDDAGADLSASNPYQVTLDADKVVKAVFAAVNTYTFSVTIAGSTWGEVQLTPLPTGGKYEEGTSVTMKVIPNPVTNFSYWEDNSTTIERTVVVDDNKSFTATFDEIPFIVGWNFKDQSTRQNKSADFYSESTNTGLLSAYEPDGTSVAWLSSAAAFSPSYPCARLWTAGAEFKTRRRYIQARFATTGYKNIQIKSLVSGNYQVYAVITLQYSTNGTDFTELARVDITDVYNSGWKELNATLPASAEGVEKVYVRWIADETSPIINEGTDNDGTAFTNIVAFADKIILEDHDAPVLSSSVPVTGSATASINGSVVLTFNEKVKAGTGDITLGNTTLTGIFGSKTASFKYEKLDYNTEYTFTVPVGALTDLSGNSFEGVVITFKTGARAEPVKKLFDAIVAADGTGDYTNVIDAIAGVPSNRTTPWLIYIQNGTYTGHHDIPNTKPFVHLIGQHRDSVIISDNRLSGNAGDGTPVYGVNQGATMVVNSVNCYFENITFENSWGFEKKSGPQALALFTNCDRIALKNCYLRSYQDTYLTAYNNISFRHYLQNCKIEGAVDFIYGGADVFFDNCTITCNRKDGGYIVAPSHQAGTAWGYVFSNCTVEGALPGVTTYFGRPWQNSPKTVFLNTTLKANVYPVGWYYKMGAIPAVFADYGTMDANGNAVDLSQRISNYEYDVKDANGNVTNTVKGVAKNKLTDAEAAAYTYENVMLRSGDTWDPRMLAEAPEKPSNVTVEGTQLEWNNIPYARLYIVFRNGKVLGFTTDTQFVDTEKTEGQSHVYEVQTVGESGTLSDKTSAVIKIVTGNPEQQSSNIAYYPNPVKDGFLFIDLPPENANANIVLSNAMGAHLYATKGISGKSMIDMRKASPGLYLLRIERQNGPEVYKVIKE